MSFFVFNTKLYNKTATYPGLYPQILFKNNFWGSVVTKNPKNHLFQLFRIFPYIFRQNSIHYRIKFSTNLHFPKNSEKIHSSFFPWIDPGFHPASWFEKVGIFWNTLRTYIQSPKMSRLSCWCLTFWTHRLWRLNWFAKIIS